jgi:hypothetical protein
MEFSMPQKVIPPADAIGAGWSGCSGMDSIVAGRQKAGLIMRSLSRILGLFTAVA